MERKMNVLFISPFENMRDTIERICSVYPNIDLTVSIGSDEDGQRIAEESYGYNYDCIISRGNTATMIRKAVSVPVIEVKVTLSDVLASLSGVTRFPAVIAAVGYKNVVSGMDYLNSFLPFDLELFGIDSADELDQVFDELTAQGIRVIVCDTVTYRQAVKRDFDAYILSSGEDSIRYAFEQVMFLSRANSTMLEENQLLRRLVSANSESETVVFDADKQLYYSSLPERDTIMGYLKEKLSDFASCNKFKLVKQQAGYIYRISAKKVTVNSDIYYAYFFSRKLVNLRNEHRSIHYYTDEEIRQELEGSVFGIANIKRYYSAELNSALSRNNPVLIYGEVGVGKNHLAELIYLNSKFSKNPFVLIDCTLINNRSWNYLLSRNDSPLCDNENTLFIKNIDAIDDSRMRELLAALLDGDVSKRNRIIISCSAKRELSAVSGLPVLKVVNQLECFVISMKPLRGQYAAIENSANLLLKDFRDRKNRHVGAIEADAMPLLLHFGWPQNYDQLIRVMEKAGTLAGAGPVTNEIVREALTAEMSLTQGETTNTSNTLLDLTKPLSEINREIVKLLLEQNGGNQSAAARSLGISRTTLWHMLKD